MDSSEQRVQELKDEGVNTEPLTQRHTAEPAIPLFMRDSPDGNKGNAQDVKDETEE